MTYNESPEQEATLQHALERCLPLTAGLGKVSQGVGDGLEDDDASEPSVDQVVGVKGDAQKRDQRVVSTSEEEERDHVNDGQDACSVPDKTSNTLPLIAEINVDDAEGDVGRKIGDEEEQLETSRESSNVYGRAHLYLAVVSLSEDRGVEEMLLECRKFRSG